MTAIGDTVIALPHIEAICDYHNESQVWLLTSSPSRSLYARHPRLNIRLLDRERWFSRASFWATWLWIRKQRFSRIYDLQGNRISRLLTRFSGASLRAGTNPYGSYTHFPSEPCTSKGRKNVFDRLNEVLVSAGLPEAEKSARMYLAPEDVARVAEWKRSHRITDKKYVVIHAGSSADRPAKRWPIDYYLELAKMIEARGLKCIWVGAGPETEINAFLSSKVGLDATGNFSLRQLYELARQALFGVSSDSCPMHIFAAAGIPVYCFFGPENWQWSYPLGQRDRVMRNDVECSPCFRGICPPEKGHACLAGVSPESVVQRIDAEFGFDIAR